MKNNYIKFRAYADDKRRYWVEARVFDTADEMRRDISKCTGEKGKSLDKTEGQVNEAIKYSAGKKTGCFSVLWLNRSAMNGAGMEITAHESVHVAVRYFLRRNWPICLSHEAKHGSPDPHENNLEERFAYAVGRIARNIGRGLFRHGVWK